MSPQTLHASEGFVTTGTVMREVMTRAPVTIEATDTIAKAHTVMRNLHCRHLPVVKQGRLVGIVSERDLFVLESLMAADAQLDVVAEAMNPYVYTTTADAKLRDVARVMAAERYGSAVVMDRDQLVGIFTATDAFRHLVAALR